MVLYFSGFTVMTFFNKAGSLLRQTLCNKHVSIQGSASNPSIFQMIRHASNKVFVGGNNWFLSIKS